MTGPGDSHSSGDPVPGPGVSLTITAPDGSESTINLTGPGGVIRLAVGRPGMSSHVWRIWSNRNSSDVYVAVSVGAGERKWSLHQSREWHDGWTSADVAMKYTGSPKRFIDSWSRPPDEWHGVARGLGICVPHGELSPMRFGEKMLRDVDWLPEAPEGHGTAIHVAVATPNRGEVPMQGGAPCGEYYLANGEAVLIVVAFPVLTQQDLDGFALARTAAMEGISASGGAPDDLRLTVGAVANDTGDRLVWDLAARHS